MGTGQLGSTQGEWERELPGLMVRYQQADAEAVARLITSLSPRLLRYFAIGRVTRHAADDRLQECWMRIHRSRHTIATAGLAMGVCHGAAHAARGFRVRVDSRTDAEGSATSTHLDTVAVIKNIRG